MDIVVGINDHPLFSALQQATSDAADAPAQAKKAAAAVDAPTDVLELPNGTLVITVDVPGVSRGDVKVGVEDGRLLVISGEQRRAADDEGVKYLRTERRVGKFVRKFPLPETANLDSVSAAYKDGVLTVTVERMPPPETETKKRKTTIEVKAG